jgi:hypothetical protein
MPCRRLTFAWTIRHLGEIVSSASYDYLFHFGLSSSEHITWIQEDLLSALKDIPTNLTLDIHIFISNKTPNSSKNDIKEDLEKLDDDAGSSGHKVEQELNNDADIYEQYHVSDPLLSLPMIKIHRERADLATFIENEVAQAQDCMSVNGMYPAPFNATKKSSIVFFSAY